MTNVGDGIGGELSREKLSREKLSWGRLSRGRLSTCVLHELALHLPDGEWAEIVRQGEVH